MHLSKRLWWLASPLAVLALLAVGLPTLAHADGSLAVTTTALPAGEVGVAYSQTVEATGGTTPYTWAVVGTLPDGLSIDATSGTISGTPTTVGTSNFTVQVTDSAATPATVTQDLAIAVVAPVSLSTTALADGTAGTAYSETLAAADGVTPYAWSITDGALPDGLGIDAATGIISGTPTVEGTATFTVQVADALGGAATQALSIAVAPASSFVVTTTSLQAGTVGQAYEQDLAASGGTEPYTWAITDGTLPDGLTLDAATGIISGTPTADGKSSFTVQATDSSATPQTATRELSIKVGSTSDSIDEQVAAACQDTTAHPALPALCRIYASGQLPTFAKGIVGRVILKLADAGHPKGHRHDRQNSRDKNKDKQGERDGKVKPTPTAARDKNKSDAFRSKTDGQNTFGSFSQGQSGQGGGED